jgi:hypothetical protein
MFIQVIDFHTSQIDEGRKHIDEWRAQTEGRRTASRGILARDRDDDTHFFNIVFFPSYEEAMRNSEMPETQALAKELMAIGDGEPTFHNLEVVFDEE